jgi:hypothetical protein
MIRAFFPCPQCDNNANQLLRHFRRVMRYARPSDWAVGAAIGAISPGLMLYWEKVSPSFVGKGGFAPVMRLSGAVAVTACFMTAYTRSNSPYRPIDICVELTPP